MAAPSYTYVLTNGATADASQVTQNFNDILNGVSDGTKDLTISALTCNGAVSLKGTVALGDAAADDITYTGSLASSIPIKTTNTYDIGSATLGLAGVYLGTSSTQTARIVSTATLASSRTYTLLDAGAAANFVLSEGAATINGAKTFGSAIVSSNGINFGGTTLSYYAETTISVTFDTGAFTGGSAQTVTVSLVRVGKKVTIFVPTVSATTNATAASFSTSGTPLSTHAPTTRTKGFAVATNNSADQAGVVDISATGVLAIFFNVNQSSTVASGTANSGSRGFAFSYIMAN